MKKSNTELTRLMNYETSLAIVQRNKTIQKQLSKFGYTSELIAEGKTLLDETMNVLRERDIQHNKRSKTYKAFMTVYGELSDTYSLHREIAKAIFRKDAGSLKKLALNGCKPSAYEKSLGGISTFYAVTISDSEVRSELARFHQTAEKLEAAKAIIPAVKAARAHYLDQEAKALESTKLKNEALAEMADWMRVFYAVAKLAIEDQKLLQLTLGKLA